MEYRIDAMNFDLHVAHSVDEIDSAAWDRLSRGRPFASARWYRFAESVLAGDVPFYLVLACAGEPVGRATLWLTKQEPLPIASVVMRRILQSMLRRWPLLVCRSPLSAAGGLILPEPPLRDTTLDVLAQAAQQIGRERQASTVMFDYLEPPETQWSAWPATFHVTSLDAGMYLELSWPDFEAYVKQLPKSVVKDYRRQRNRANDLGLVITADQTPPLEREALPLIRNVERRHHAAPNPWVAGILQHAHLTDSTWLKATIADRLVGCGLLIGEGDTRSLALLGLDYEVSYVYFQLIYAAIRCAIEQGVRVLRGGTGTYELKQRLGFQPENNNCLVYTINNRMLRWLARGLV